MGVFVGSTVTVVLKSGEEIKGKAIANILDKSKILHAQECILLNSSQLGGDIAIPYYNVQMIKYF